ncbi:MAG TPA: hypothetical protein VK511_06370 [Gemmatimonadaceae bacterium]|nr:hypothetical protein [Gemmatimonadaceae bacterium]
MLLKSAAALRMLLSLSFAAGPLAARAQTVSAACKPLLDANTKEISTPHHAYSTERSSPTAAQATTGEMITTATESFLLYKGKWMKGLMTPQENIAQMQENLRNTKVYECKKLPDASLDGVVTTVYSAHSENDMAKTDTQLWVDKSTGLILREEIDMYADEGGGKRHISMRFDYKNVQPPPGLK